MTHSSDACPSSWVTRFAPLIRQGGSVLDLACGGGRNARWLAQQGWRVEAVDRDPAAIAGLRGVKNISALQADLEVAPWPYPGRKFDGVVVCRYLYRPLLPVLAASLAEGGVLIYETFMLGQERYGRPSNPDFLLRPDELLEACSGALQVIAFEQGIFNETNPAMLQRICARR
ncbi:MAG TPA: class I SAM-dependent methyltransferase [Methylophilaceae bacterium]|nr:class I SAM-dependent methyltransferase [Methylophilaceae bacterium]HQR60301.1 class I SAM-dependent methyltransferase [Methylophilaceae bacterium]